MCAVGDLAWDCPLGPPRGGAMLRSPQRWRWCWLTFPALALSVRVTCYVGICQ